MKLWIDGKNGSVGSAIRATVKEQVADINRKVISRGISAANAIRSAELRVLEGQRSGKSRRKYPYKTMYRPSVPGEPPAQRTGNLRLHWKPQVKRENRSGGGVAIAAELESQERYAVYLENGTRNMAPRPFVEKIKEEAAPEIRKIYSEPYT